MTAFVNGFRASICYSSSKGYGIPKTWYGHEGTFRSRLEGFLLWHVVGCPASEEIAELL